MRVLNVARGPAGGRGGPEGGARLAARSPGRRSTCSTTEPMTEHPLFGYPNVIVTPHLGASTAEATDRAGYQAAEQVVAALTGGVVTSAVNVPGDPSGGHGGAGAVRGAVPGARPDRHRALARARRSTGSRPSSWAGSPSATRGCCRSRCCWGCCAATPRRRSTRSTRRRWPRSAGSRSTETKRTGARDYTDLIRVTVTSGEDSVRVVGHADRAAQPSAPAGGLGPAVRRPARGARHAVPLPGRPRDDRARRDDLRQPRHQHRRPRPSAGSPTTSDGGDDRLAAMVITTDSPVPPEVLDEVAQGEGFVAGANGTLELSTRLARRLWRHTPSAGGRSRDAGRRSRGPPPGALDAATMCEAFQMTVAERPDQVALRTIGDGRHDHVRGVRGAGQAAGRRRFTRSACDAATRSGFMLTNRPEFHLIDTAAMHLGRDPVLDLQHLLARADRLPARRAPATGCSSSRPRSWTGRTRRRRAGGAGRAHWWSSDGGARGTR